MGKGSKVAVCVGSVAGGGELGKVLSAALRGVRRSSGAWAGTLVRELDPSCYN